MKHIQNRNLSFNSPNSKFIFVSISILILFHFKVRAFETYDLIEALLPHEKLPRVLNSIDIDLNPNDPQPMFSPMGDFNADGIPDMAIVGTYGPLKKNITFLLVGTQFQNPIRYQQLFFKEYPQPVFLHKPGTTGEKDPGDQAFSITSCSQCTDGIDFYWDNKKQTFELRPWEKRFRRYQNVPHMPELDLVAPEIVDKALQLVGNLTDVKIFVAGLKKAKKHLGTRVKPSGIRGVVPETQVIVEIFEKKKDRKKVYDEVTVDVETGMVIERKTQRR